MAKAPTPLRLAIAASGRLHQDIAAEAGISPSHLSRIVNGLHAPQATRDAIADALDREVSELFPEPADAAA